MLPRQAEVCTGSEPARQNCRSALDQTAPERAVCLHVCVECSECGYVYGRLAAADFPDALRSVGGRYRSALVDASQPGALLRARPKPDVWSPLEYACHVRDVLLTQRERVLLALVEDQPTFAPMY
jgi:hypothetical protein